MKCPHCGSKNVVGTNKAKRALAWTVGGGAALLSSVFVRAGAPAIGLRIAREICPQAKFICLECKREFSTQLGS